MHKSARLLKIGILFFVLITQGCMGGVPSEKTNIKGWYKNADFIYDLWPDGRKTKDDEGATSSRMTMDVEDWNGYYDPYGNVYRVFPMMGTCPAPEVEDDIKSGLVTALEKIKTRMDTERHGTVYFGSSRFKGALIDFHFEGEIRDLGNAFGVLNKDEQTTVTLQQCNLKVDAPVPFMHRNSWRVIVNYPRKLISSNAPEHDLEQKKLIWTDKTVKEERIRFEIVIPACENEGI